MTLPVMPNLMRSIPGYSYRRSYTMDVFGAVPVAAAYVIMLTEAGVMNLNWRRLTITNPGYAGSAQNTQFGIYQTVAVRASGGAVATPSPLDSAQDTAFGGLAYSGVATTPVGATLGNLLYSFTLWTPAAIAAFNPPFVLDFTNEIIKAPTIRGSGWIPAVKAANQPGGVAAVGLALVNITGATGYAGFSANLEFTEDSY